ncbi:hypothetical protein ACJZ2D_002762 [Fusarium nematophilum]
MFPGNAQEIQTAAPHPRFGQRSLNLAPISVVLDPFFKRRALETTTDWYPTRMQCLPQEEDPCIQCDGQRPICESCRRRGEPDLCIYAAEGRGQAPMTRETDQILELFGLLKSVPESQALDVLRIVRCGHDLESTLSMVRAKNPQPGATGQEWTAISTRHPGLEYELMARNPVSFPPLQPLESSILNPLFRLAFELTLGRAALGSSHAPAADSEGVSSSDPDVNPFPAHLSTGSPISTLGPCDERLEELDMSFWTSVPIANDVAARIISLYLETDHPLLGTFDPDLFADDLVNRRLGFCSPLLVSTVMYWGCQMYSASDPATKAHIPLFGEEAEKRWSDERVNDSLLNLASAQLLSLAYLGDGKDHFVLTYVSEANAMGIRMGLFGIKPTAAAEKAREVSPELQRATSYAAWGTFNWIVLMSLFYQQPGLSYPEYPPVTPIPGHAWHHNPDDSVESVHESLESTYMGDTFPALCRFWRIIHEVTLRYYRDQPRPREGLSGHVSLAFAEYKYRELIAWAETLPPSMMRSAQSPHHVLIFHIWLHAAILDIFRPFTVRARAASKPLRLKTFPCKRSSPDAAYKASVNQLKRLIIVYRKRYASSTYTMLWHTALIHVANAILGDTKDPAWRFYLLFCIQCYGHLRQSYRFAEAIGRSLLSMTLQRGALSPSEARRMMEQFEENRQSSPSDDIRATFMADLNLAMTDPKEASVERLALRFEDIALFQEFTNQEGSSEDESMEDEAEGGEAPN